MNFFPWLGRVVVANIALLILFTSVAIISVSRFALEWFMHWASTTGATFEWVFEEEAFQTFAVAWIIFAAVYGIVRGWIFHPLTDARYHDWLTRSPWKVGKPLPKGPVHPTWLDGVTLASLTLIVAAAVAFFDMPAIWIAGPPLAMVVGMVFSWTGINLLSHQRAGLVVLLVAPLSILFPAGGIGFVAGMLGTAGIAYYGVWRLLSEMHTTDPFNKQFADDQTVLLNRRGMERQKSVTVGWPYSSLLHEPDNRRLPPSQALAYAAIAAAWFSVVVFLPTSDAERQEIAFIIVMFLMFTASACRIVFDAVVMCPRFCLGHRLAKRQFFVPEHDRLFLWPLLIALGGAIPLLLGRYLDGFVIGAIVSCGLVVYLFFTLGRPVTEAFYTGPQTITPGIRNAQSFAKLAAPGD